MLLATKNEMFLYSVDGTVFILRWNIDRSYCSVYAKIITVAILSYHDNDVY